MPNILIRYATVEGQTARIAKRNAQTLCESGHVAKTRLPRKDGPGLESAI